MVKKCTALVKVISVLAILSFIPLSCKMGLVEKEAEVSSLPGTGSLEVSSGNGDAVNRSLDVSNLTYAKAFVTGKGISSAITSDFIKMTDGRKNISVSNIPVGKNRIVTIQAYDSEKNIIAGGVIRAITDISSGNNECSVSQGTTALANFFVKLDSLGKDISAIVDDDLKAIENYFEGNTISWALLDTARLASDYIASKTVLSSKALSEYELSTGVVSISSSITNSYSVRITDPSSKTEALSSSNTITNAAPGTWNIQVLSGNNIVARDTIKVVSGETTNVTVNESVGGSVSGRILVHVPASYGYIKAYAWGGSAASAGWPGDAMTLNGDVYDYELNCTSSNIVFNGNGQTNDLYITEGEWTYNGKNVKTESDVNANFTEVIDDGETKVTISVVNPVVPGEDSIIVHAKYTHIWAWETGNTANNYTGGVWPGREMVSEGNGWYRYTLNYPSADVICYTSDNDRSKPDGQGGDTLTAGEWWFKGGIWYKSNPDRPSTPVVKASVAGGTYNVAQTVNLTSNNSGDVIYYTLDGSLPSSDSSVYSSAITISSTCILKAIGYNAEAETQWGEVLSVSYVIDADADLEAPVIVPSKEAGRYQEAISVSFTFTDNKGSAGVTAYYTTDNSTPTTSSAKYTSGKTIPVAMDAHVTIRILAVDAAGNGTSGVYYYSVGKTPEATRWDPRQESIYFIVTARWFDGDAANTVGDQWCSSDEDPSWRGDFKGLVEKMDYIKALGFTCIWITPVVQNRGPLCYHGYHAWDMYKEDARLVSDGYDFQRVIDEAHARGMKICLDVVLQHSGRFGLKDFAEIKYNRDPKSYPVAVGWEDFEYDEAAYESAYRVANKTGIASVQHFPNNWEYDGLKSPGRYPAGWTIDGVDVGGQVIPPSADVLGDTRPFTAADFSVYPNLKTDVNNAGVSPYQWPTTQSYQLTIDTGDFTVNGVNGSATANYTYDQYVAKPGLHLHGWANGFNDSGMFDKYPDANLRSIHEDCPDLNTESSEVQEYVIGAYKRYIDMGVDMFRVDTVMHIDKQTLNDHFWPAFMEEAASENAKAARGGGDFFIFGEVANFVNNLLNDKPAPIRQCNYTWDNTVVPDSADCSNNHYLNGNNYRTPDYSHKAVPESDYHVSTIDIVSHNGFCDGVSGAYGRTLGTDGAYNDATYLTWYTDSHDYGPNKGQTRWQGDFAGAWSMLFTFRGIPIVYYGSEIRFAAGKPNDWPGSVKNTLNETGRAYYGEHLEGNVTATDFGVYSASGEVATTLNAAMSKHLRDLNKIRLAVPALQMGQYSTNGHSGGWAGYKRRYTGTNKITGEAIDSYCLVGVGSGTHTWTGVLNGTYIDAVSGSTVTVSNGTASYTPKTGGDSTDAALVVLVYDGLTTKAPGKVASESPYFGY